VFNWQTRAFSHNNPRWHQPVATRCGMHPATVTTRWSIRYRDGQVGRVCVLWRSATLDSVLMTVDELVFSAIHFVLSIQHL